MHNEIDPHLSDWKLFDGLIGCAPVIQSGWFMTLAMKVTDTPEKGFFEVKIMGHSQKSYTWTNTNL
jgi:hypothetical protein